KFDTSQCTKGEPCEFTSSAWSSSEVADGTNVGLNVQGNGFCNGKSVKFEVFENELVGRNPAQTNPVNVVFNGNTATGTWTAEWIDDGFAQGNPEYVFKASLASDSNIFIDNSGELTVLPDGGFGGYCGDGVINTGETCDGTEWGPITGCSNFDEFTGGSLSCVNCKFDTSACTGGTAGSCGDGVINTGETCDGTEWGPITGCSNFDEFTGGSLSCVNCKFDTSQCTGGFGIYCLNITSCSNYLTSGECSADACDVAEASVEANNPLITCGEAGVSCECAWVSNICEPSYTSVAGGYIIGTCSYDESTDDDCEDGFLSYNWIATWTWGHDGWVDWNNGPSSDVNDYELDAGKYYYDPDSKFDDCQDGSTLVECPASIQVGFFGVWNFIIAVIILGVIYWMWNLRKKKTSKKKK
ncbi:hypothetical protein KAT80_03425, partial [Candidatus Pacearchaeota archaeon]|nr:hypothetical protein [Candidatus Pacearchaeota archaeon]